MALINKLNDIGDAIRAKTGKEDKLTLEQMVTEIAAIEGGGSELPEEAFVITGNCKYRFANDGWNWFIDTFGNQIITKDITNFDNMFSNATLKEIPFELNANSGSDNHSIDYIFNYCYQLTTVPKINNLKPSRLKYFFENCIRLREIPFDFCDNWDWTYIDGLTTSPYLSDRSHTFSYCYSLRSFPMEFLAHASPIGAYSSSIYSYAFNECYTLDEIINLPIPYTATWTSNAFSYSFNECYRLKNLTFALQEDGTPYTMNWKSQTIDLSKNVGYCNWTGSGSGVSSENLTEAQKQDISDFIINYNSGITVDKMVYDEASYQALKDDPDWYYIKPSSGDKEPYYSRYNHDSAVATINSLPDTSAYLASAGGTNTIKFKGDSGSKTDGGAINTLTEEEIAVAAAKGWTVSLV